MNLVTPYLPYIYAAVPAVATAVFIATPFIDNELADEKLIGNAPGEGFVKDHTAKVVQEMGFTKPIRVARNWDTKNPLANRCFHAVGGTIIPGQCGFTTPYLEGIPKCELEVSIAHELSHVQANDNITIPFVPLIAGVAVGILFACVDFSSTASFVVGSVTWAVTNPLVSRWREREADRNAMKYCSEQAKRGMLDIHKKEKGLNNGHGFLLDILQPTRDDKIKIIQESLASEVEKA